MSCTTHKWLGDGVHNSQLCSVVWDAPGNVREHGTAAADDASLALALGRAVAPGVALTVS